MYLFCLAVNGTLECFTVASMSDSNLEKYTFHMVLIRQVPNHGPNSYLIPAHTLHVHTH